MKIDIILAGVGGQGILTVAAVIGEAAVEQQLYMKQAEVHGMSQRGGEVQSHLRLGSRPVASDLIPLGQADMILSLEPLEALRYLPYLKADGWVISNAEPFLNIDPYPEREKWWDVYEKLPNKVILDVADIAKKLGAPRAGNMVLLGAAAAHLPLPISSLENGIRRVFGRKGAAVVELNLKALHCHDLSGQF
jgi:indolepyruvate ferredoxin oxidoreductase beta subunit